MKKEEMFNIIGEVDEQKVAVAGMAMTARKKSHPVWLKWGAIAACLCLVVVGAVLPMMNNKTSTRHQEELTLTTHPLDEVPAVDEVEVVEVNGVQYVVCGKGEETILQECGIPTELTKDLAGEHVCYLGVSDNRYTPVEKADDSEENAIELFEYAPEPNENVYIMCRYGEYFAAIRKDGSGYHGLTD